MRLWFSMCVCVDPMGRDGVYRLVGPDEGGVSMHVNGWEEIFNHVEYQGEGGGATLIKNLSNCFSSVTDMYTHDQRTERKGCERQTIASIGMN